MLSFFKIKTDNTSMIYESLLIGMFLAFVGGILDVYTYILRGGVFAFAQTGNMLLMAIKIANGDLKGGLYYLVPIMTFIAGVFFTEYLKKYFDNEKTINYFNVIIIIEIAVLILIAFLPKSVPDNIVCIIVSFISAMQTNCFRKLSGFPYATTMCTGNLRTGSEYLYIYFTKKDKNALKKALQLFIIIFTFIIGAIFGTLCTMTIEKYSTLVGVIILVGVLTLTIYKQGKISTSSSENIA